MRIATCDDQIQYCEQVETFVSELGDSLGITIECDKYQSGKELLSADYDQYRIIFLDIDMVNENGISIAEKIRESNKRVEIVFLTALVQYAVEGYKVDAYRFLVKPVEYEDFEFELRDLLLKLADEKPDTLVLKDGNQIYKIKQEDLIYIEAKGHVIVYHCVEGDYIISTTMKKAENSLDKNYFKRIHNSYIINLEYLANLGKNEVQLKNGLKLPMSRRKKEEFVEQYVDYLGDKMS